MMRRRQLVLGIAALAIAGAWLLGPTRLTPSHLAASFSEPLVDTDGDLLPDALEWTVLADPLREDSDRDGRDDFLEVVQHTSALQMTGTMPVDQEMRLALCSAVDKQSGLPHVWMHCLFRFASGQLDLRWFVPFISATVQGNPTVLPITELVGRAPMNVQMRSDPQQGLFVIVSMRLATVAEFSRILPCTVNARAAIGSRFVCSSAYAFEVNGVLNTLVSRGRDVPNQRLLVQTLAPHSGSRTSTSTPNRACEQTLVQTGMSTLGPVYEVITSECTMSEGLRCESVCPQLINTSVVVPDGLGALTGG
jgi:hypothetical protein